MESSIAHIIGIAIITYAPAYIANMMPPIAGAMQWPGALPLSVRTLGPNKTYRGLYAGIIGGLLCGALLWALAFGWYGGQFLPVATVAGGIMGLGALVGDAVKSAIKRRLGIASGEPFFPWDQLDFIFGSTLFGLLIMPIPASVFATALVITPLLHIAVNILAYCFKLKRVWW